VIGTACHGFGILYNLDRCLRKGCANATQLRIALAAALALQYRCAMLNPAINPQRSAFLLHFPDFGRFWAGTFLINIGVQIQNVAIGWQVYELARQTMTMGEAALMIGLVGLAHFLPLFALTLYAGSLADRHSRLRISVLSIGAQVLSVAWLAYIAASEVQHFSAYFVAAAVFGAARAFLAPAATAVVPMLVTLDAMPRAIAMKSVSWQLATVAGPWAGGLAIAAVAAQGAFALAAGLMVAGLMLLVLIKSPTTPERQAGGKWAQIKEGLAYVWGNKLILGAISLDLFAVLLGGATALLPAFAADILQVGPEGFGLLRAGPAIGAVAVALVLARWPLKRYAGRRMLWAVAVFGAATIVFGLSRNLYLSLAALTVLGAADMISVFVRQTLVQVVTPDHMRGRVSSVSGLFIAGSNEMGEFESGFVARFIGPVAAVVVGGIGTLAITGLWAYWFPALRRADRLDGKDS
jgi:MFS family permease